MAKKSTKKNTGRKKKTAVTSQSPRLDIRGISPAEFKAIKAAAVKDRRSMNQWCRIALCRAAGVED